MAEMRAELVGLLIEKHGERAKIKLYKDKSKGEKIPKYLEAWCPINAKVGDVVGVEYQEMNKRKMQMILYGFPVLSVIAGAGCWFLLIMRVFLNVMQYVKVYSLLL